MLKLNESGIVVCAGAPAAVESKTIAPNTNPEGEPPSIRLCKVRHLPMAFRWGRGPDAVSRHRTRLNDIAFGQTVYR